VLDHASGLLVAVDQPALGCEKRAMMGGPLAGAEQEDVGSASVLRRDLFEPRRVYRSNS